MKKMKKKGISRAHRGTRLIIFLLAAALSLPAAVFAAPPEGSGPPEGKGPGNNGRSDDDVRGGDLFGDPWVVVRDLTPDADGKPVYFTWTWPPGYYTPDGELELEPGMVPSGYSIPEDQSGAEGCVQPLSMAPLVDVASENQFLYSSYFDSYGPADYDVYLIPLDDECKIPEIYEGTWGEQVLEIDAGRLNLARTTQSVLDAAYEEALLAINTATAIDLDAGGRLLLTLPGETEGETTLKTIDSPRENLALYQELMKTGCLTKSMDAEAQALFAASLELASLVTCEEAIGNADVVPSSNDLLRAASLFAGGADKFSHVGIDEVVYVNSMLGINAVDTYPDGTMYITEYQDLGDFTYIRSLVHDGTVARLLQPIGDSLTDFTVVDGVDIYRAVFLGDWSYYIAEENGEEYTYPLMNFVRATDDAVSIIYYIHNFEPPVMPVPQVL